MRLVLPLLVLALLAGCTESVEDDVRRYPLDLSWEFSGNDTIQWSKATVPGFVHLDLLDNGVIGDPYADNNEIELQWIEEEDWQYKTVLEVGDSILEFEHIELEFKGLDTYCELILNDTSILKADNMFREWTVDVKPFLRKGTNSIKLLFTSAIHYNGDRVKNYRYELPAGNETVPLKVSPFSRKAAYHFGWDWGPRFVGCGIWRPVYLNCWNHARITDTYCSTKEIGDTSATIDVEINVEVGPNEEEDYILHIDGQERSVRLHPGLNELHFDHHVKNPQLWWPNEMGSQHMYQMNVELHSTDEVLDRHKLSYGIRSIELVNEKDSIGTSFYFLVNGEKVFVKGANYIPQDHFTTSVSRNDYRSIIKKAKDAHMNMVRVWGGGIYQNDEFYELCDSNGIMVWQDFMFAGSMYPAEELFKENVEHEVVDNIKRLRNYPSLALWCGNNEIDVAWHNWGWQNKYGYSDKDSLEIWNNYLEMFHRRIPTLVNKMTPDIPYTTTSPLSNWGTAENFNHGSMHYWGVWHGREPFENFESNVPRFMVEYGFQSFPSYSLLSDYIDQSELNLSSRTMENRQKSYIGNGLITAHSERWFGPFSGFEDYILKSQKTQALAMKMAIIEHRLGKPHCMGTMFWQLNDSWPGPSWSVLEYGGEEKLAYGEVQKWYQQVIAVCKPKGDKLQIIVVSDLQESFDGVLQLHLKTEDGEVERLEFPFKIEKNGVKKVVELPISRGTATLVRVLRDGKLLFEDECQDPSLESE